MGVALLINTTKPYAYCGDKEWCLEDKHVRIVHSHPRSLVATIRAPHLEITVAVLHGPTTAATANTRKTWWAETRELLSKWTPDFVFLDANAKLNSDCRHDDLIGDKGWTAGKRDYNGQELFDTIVEQELRLLNTLPDDPQGYTGVHNDGSCHRIDYLCANEEWASHVTSVGVDYSFDNGLRADDHFPVIGQINAKYLRSPPSNGDAWRLDHRKLQDSETVGIYQQELADYRQPHWDIA